MCASSQAPDAWAWALGLHLFSWYMQVSGSWYMKVTAGHVGAAPASSQPACFSVSTFPYPLVGCICSSSTHNSVSITTTYELSITVHVTIYTLGVPCLLVSLALPSTLHIPCTLVFFVEHLQCVTFTFLPGTLTLPQNSLMRRSIRGMPYLKKGSLL